MAICKIFKHYSKNRLNESIEIKKGETAYWIRKKDSDNQLLETLINSGSRNLHTTNKGIYTVTNQKTSKKIKNIIRNYKFLFQNIYKN